MRSTCCQLRCSPQSSLTSRLDASVDDLVVFLLRRRRALPPNLAHWVGDMPTRIGYPWPNHPASTLSLVGLWKRNQGRASTQPTSGLQNAGRDGYFRPLVW